MLTIKNIDKIIGIVFANGWYVNTIETRSNMYRIDLIKEQVIYDPYNFQPIQRTYERTITLSRICQNGTYALAGTIHFTQLTLADVSNFDKFKSKIKLLLHD